MEYGAIDLHLRRSQIRILAEDETVVLIGGSTRRGRSSTGCSAGRPRLRMLLESSTESEWVAQHLEALGHEVIVADPNYAPMYGSRSRKVKTDKRDVAALAMACRRGIYRAAHRASAAARALRQTMRVRQQLVRQRSGLISLLRALLRQEGLRLPAGSAERVLHAARAGGGAGGGHGGAGAAAGRAEPAHDDAGRRPTRRSRRARRRMP